MEEKKNLIQMAKETAKDKATKAKTFAKEKVWPKAKKVAKIGAAVGVGYAAARVVDRVRSNSESEVVDFDGSDLELDHMLEHEDDDSIPETETETTTD